MIKPSLEEIKLSKGYATVRQLMPLDHVKISKILGEQINDTSMVNNAVIAYSIMSLTTPNYDQYPNDSDFLILDETEPNNYELDENDEKIPDPKVLSNWELDKDGKRIKDLSDSTKYLLRDLEDGEDYVYKLDSRNPHNYILDPAKGIRRDFPPSANSLKELQDRMMMPYSEWSIISERSMMINQPNPYLLGK